MSAEDSKAHGSEALLGTVVSIQANYYSVQLDADAQGDRDLLLCIRRGLLKKLGQQIMVGDRVTVEEPDWKGMRGAIAQIHPRKTSLDRPPIANVDQILLVFALAEPLLDPHQLSRFLIKAESTGMPVTLCLNKRDLLNEAELADWNSRLEAWGYDALPVSIRGDEALNGRLLATLEGRLTVVAGPSGVGKSSLTNRLIPEQDQRVSAVSGKLGRGRHTTRHVELFELPGGGFLADTPGFNHPDIDCAPEDLETYFPEIRDRLSAHTCQFSNCLHRDEPGCVVRGDWDRYDYYLTLLEEIIKQQEARMQQRDEEATEKVKMMEAGKVLREPRLAAKKYRRASRKTRNQAFQELCLDLSTVEDLEDLADLEDLGL